jgi:hypothetical protein
LQDCGNAQRKGKGNFIRRLTYGVARTTDKHHRIQSLIPHCEAGRFHVARSFPPQLYRIDDRGVLRGTLGEQIASYTYGADESYDCLDAAADIWGYDGVGQVIFKSPTYKQKEKTLDWANPWDYLKDWYDKHDPTNLGDSA